MINRIMALLILLNLSACQSKQNDITEELSASGLAYTLINMPDNNRITIRIAWPNRWTFSEDLNQAVPQIGTRLLLAGGAQGYPAGEVVERFNDINTQGSVSVTTEYIFGTLHYSPEHQDESLKTANAHLKSPLLNEQWFERIRDQFAVQMKEGRSSAVARGFGALRWAIFGDQSIRVALSLDEENVIESVTRDEVVTWAKSVFSRKDATITIAGDLSAKDAGMAVDALLEGLPEGEPNLIGKASSDFSAKRILLHAPESTTSTLSFIGKLPALSENAELEELLLVAAMGGDMKSGLLGAVRDELRASYRFSAEVSGFTANQRFVIFSGQVETSKIADVENKIREAYSDFRANPVIDDLQKFKAPFEKDFKEFSKDTGSTSNSVLFAKLLGMDTARTLELQKELDAITEEDLSHRIKTGFPKIDDFIVLVDSPDDTALPDACVITTPRQAVDC